jgi:hypothetical protein
VFSPAPSSPSLTPTPVPSSLAVSDADGDSVLAAGAAASAAGASTGTPVGSDALHAPEVCATGAAAATATASATVVSDGLELALPSASPVGTQRSNGLVGEGVGGTPMANSDDVTNEDTLGLPSVHPPALPASVNAKIVVGAGGGAVVVPAAAPAVPAGPAVPDFSSSAHAGVLHMQYQQLTESQLGERKAQVLTALTCALQQRCGDAATAAGISNCTDGSAGPVSGLVTGYVAGRGRRAT